MPLHFTIACGRTVPEGTNGPPPVGAPQDFMECLIPALLAALPYFLDSLIACLRGNGGNNPGDFNPGNRDRGCD